MFTAKKQTFSTNVEIRILTLCFHNFAFYLFNKYLAWIVPLVVSEISLHPCGNGCASGKRHRKNHKPLGSAVAICMAVCSTHA